jgi:alpha/beta superfamily hydrolase
MAPDMSRQEQRMVTIPVPDTEIVLEGIFMAGEEGETPGAIVAPPHPLMGGSMDSPVVNEVAYACKAAGYATLMFNWRGVGASSGAPSGENDDGDADYAAALAHLAETVPGPLLAAGYSFGGAAAVRVACNNPRVRRLVLVAPPPMLISEAQLAQSTARSLLVSGTDDDFVPLSTIEAWVAANERLSLEVVPDADHFFGVGLAAVGKSIKRFLGV